MPLCQPYPGHNNPSVGFGEAVAGPSAACCTLPGPWVAVGTGGTQHLQDTLLGKYSQSCTFEIFYNLLLTLFESQ